jgi:hypothetical protein
LKIRSFSTATPSSSTDDIDVTLKNVVFQNNDCGGCSGGAYMTACCAAADRVGMTTNTFNILRKYYEGIRVYDDMPTCTNCLRSARIIITLRKGITSMRLAITLAA